MLNKYLFRIYPYVMYKSIIYKNKIAGKYYRIKKKLILFQKKDSLIKL